jgi:hypothetical protein
MMSTHGTGTGDGKKRPSNNRIAVWIIIGAFALYLIGSGLYGMLTN